MKAIKLTIGTENAAFFGDPGPEVAKILRELAEMFAHQSEAGIPSAITLRDCNGNKVGLCIVEL